MLLIPIACLEVLQNAIHALRAFGPAAAAAVPALIKPLEDPEGHIARETAHALGDIRAHVEEAVEALGMATRRRDPLVRLSALEGLVGFEEQAIHALPDLIRALEDEDDQNRAPGGSRLARSATPPVRPLRG